MHFLLFLALMQTTPIPTTPNLHSRAVLRVSDFETDTTPHLDRNAPAVAPYEMGRDIGGMIGDIGRLQSDVTNLQRQRDDEAKDINNLKETKLRIVVWAWVISTVLVMLGAFSRSIWREMVLPRIRSAVQADMKEAKGVSG